MYRLDFCRSTNPNFIPFHKPIKLPKQWNLWHVGGRIWPYLGLVWKSKYCCIFQRFHCRLPNIFFNPPRHVLKMITGNLRHLFQVRIARLGLITGKEKYNYLPATEFFFFSFITFAPIFLLFFFYLSDCALFSGTELLHGLSTTGVLLSLLFIRPPCCYLLPRPQRYQQPG